MQNPYASPTASVLDMEIPDEPYEPRIFSAEGRIGRLRYLVYSFIVQFATACFAGAMAAVVVPLIMHRSDSSALLIPMLVLIYIPLLAAMFVMAKRRLNDLNHSGWLSLLLLIPLVNVVLALYLLFWPGTKGRNDYGPRPVKNSLALILFGLVLPLVLIGMLAAIAVPAYQDYVERARAASTQNTF